MSGRKAAKAAKADKASAPSTPERPEWLKLLRPRFFLILAVWLLLFAVFIALEWAAVYFFSSLIALMLWNTSTKPRRPGQKSAYSVFNPNFERLDGELDVSTIEKEIRRQMY